MSDDVPCAMAISRTVRELEARSNLSFTSLCCAKTDDPAWPLEIALPLFTNEANKLSRLNLDEPASVSRTLECCCSNAVASANKVKTSSDREDANIWLVLLEEMQMPNKSPEEQIRECHMLPKLEMLE